MTENSVQELATPESTEKSSNKEVNIRNLAKAKEAAEARAEQERQEKEVLLRRMEELERSLVSKGEPEDIFEGDDYVEASKVKKAFHKIEKRMEESRQETLKLLEEQRRKDMMFRIKAEFPDFSQVVNGESAAELEQRMPSIAKSISKIPDEFDRLAAAYEAIKTFNTYKKGEDKNVAEKVAQNQKNPYFRDTGMGNSSSHAGDFSRAGQKSAFEAMRALQSQRRSV